MNKEHLDVFLSDKFTILRKCKVCEDPNTITIPSAEYANLKEDAERYRYLKPNYVMANFDIYEAENKEDRVCGIIFEMPQDIKYSADLDATIDQAIKELT